jgi:hypothetical protein
VDGSNGKGVILKSSSRKKKLLQKKLPQKSSSSIEGVLSWSDANKPSTVRLATI